MFDRMLVPLDGSPFSEAALPLATELARARQAQLHLLLVHVPPDFAGEVPRSLVQEIEGGILAQQQLYLTQCASRARADGARVTETLLDGNVVAAIQEYVSAHAIQLVVMTTHGRGGFRRLWLGSVADSLIRSLPVPVLVIRATEKEPQRVAEARIERVLVATDGSAAAMNAFRAALHLCRALHAECVVARVVPWPVAENPIFLPQGLGLDDEQLAFRTTAASESLREYVDISTATGVTVTTTVMVHTRPADAILRCASEQGADLIVLGTHGHHRVARWLLGSVADKVVRSAELPVLVCPEDLAFAVPAAELEVEELVDEIC